MPKWDEISAWLAELGGPPEKIELVAWRGDTLLAARPVHGIHLRHAFVGDDSHGNAQNVHTRRARRRPSA